MRFRVAELLVVMCVAAFACGALARPTPLFETLFFSFTLLCLFTATILAIGRTGDARLYWIGFAVCGWLYLYLAGIPDKHELTTKILESSYWWVHENGFNALNRPGGESYDAVNAFVRIGQSAWAVLFGWIGGHATCFVYRRSRQADAQKQ